MSVRLLEADKALRESGPRGRADAPPSIQRASEPDQQHVPPSRPLLLPLRQHATPSQRASQRESQQSVGADSLVAFLTENAEALATGDEEGDEGIEKLEGALAPKAEPPLSMFDGEIDRYLKQAKAISALPSMANRGWLRIDSKPVKQALATWVNKWQYRYTEYLQQSIESTLTRRVLVQQGCVRAIVPHARLKNPDEARFATGTILALCALEQVPQNRHALLDGRQDVNLPLWNVPTT